MPSRPARLEAGPSVPTRSARSVPPNARDAAMSQSLPQRTGSSPGQVSGRPVRARLQRSQVCGRSFARPVRCSQAKAYASLGCGPGHAFVPSGSRRGSRELGGAKGELAATARPSHGRYHGTAAAAAKHACAHYADPSGAQAFASLQEQPRRSRACFHGRGLRAPGHAKVFVHPSGRSYLDAAAGPASRRCMHPACAATMAAGSGQQSVRAAQRLPRCMRLCRHSTFLHGRHAVCMHLGSWLLGQRPFP